MNHVRLLIKGACLALDRIFMANETLGQILAISDLPRRSQSKLPCSVCIRYVLEAVVG